MRLELKWSAGNLEPTLSIQTVGDKLIVYLSSEIENKVLCMIWIEILSVGVEHVTNIYTTLVKLFFQNTIIRYKLIWQR